jgi:hypothetical protein
MVAMLKQVQHDGTKNPCHFNDRGFFLSYQLLAIGYQLLI